MKAPIFDVTTSDPSVADEFELLVIGTPAIGLRPAPEVSSFIESLPECKGKKAILFGTYAMRMGGALKILEKELAEKGCVILLGVSKRVLRKGKADFSEALAEIKKVTEKQERYTEK